MSDGSLPAKVQAIADKYDADLLAYFGDISRPNDDELISACRDRKRRKNVILLLTTRGGDPNAAYRMGRCLQMVYSPPKTDQDSISSRKDGGNFSVLVNSICKSAGTLLAVSADTLYMTGNAELGPLDIQLRKPDEVGERTSGLTPIQATQYLENQSIQLFKRHFKMLRFDSELIFSTKMAAKTATKMTRGLLAPIYEQIDPIRLAEINRSLNISAEYGERLSRNLKDGALVKLISKYPSHGFVIDREEAKDLFNDVRKPPDDLFEIAEIFKGISQEYLDHGHEFFMFLNDRAPETKPESQDDANDAENHDRPSGSGPGTADGEASPDARARGDEASAPQLRVAGERER